MARLSRRVPFEVDVSEPLQLNAQLATEIRGATPLHRKSSTPTLVDKMRALPMNYGVRVRWIAENGNKALAKERCTAKVLEAMKRVRREAKKDGLAPPVFTAYEGKDDSILVFRGGETSSAEPQGPVVEESES